MEKEVREILDVFKDEPEVDCLLGKPLYIETGDDLVIDGHFSLESLDKKLAEVVKNIKDSQQISTETDVFVANEGENDGRL